jgi:hypothetical protein
MSLIKDDTRGLLSMLSLPLTRSFPRYHKVSAVQPVTYHA